MTDRSIAATIAVGFFVIWLAILLAGADFPPPIEFLWVILLDLLAACLVYVRTPAYSNWLDNGEKIKGWLRALLDGLAVGLVFALAAMLFSGGGEPSRIPLDWVDYLIWFSVLSVVGAANAGFVYCIVYIMKQYKRR